VRSIIAKKGVKGLYAGIDSALFREISYAAIRLGLYKVLIN
jgi:hypothetical protein